MKLTTTDIHNRTLQVTDLPAGFPDFHLVLSYTADGEPRVTKAVALDNYVIPEILQWQAKVAKYEEALREIAKGEGTFSRDQLTFANSVIENAKRIATEAL